MWDVGKVASEVGEVAAARESSLTQPSQSDSLFGRDQWPTPAEHNEQAGGLIITNVIRQNGFCENGLAAKIDHPADRFKIPLKILVFLYRRYSHVCAIEQISNHLVESTSRLRPQKV
jgi:hypothetical protein